MGFDRTISFTERFLLNGYVLDVICPTNCVKNEIKQSGNSIIETLINSPKDIFANEIKTGRVHYVTKPLKAVVRVAVISVSLLTVSPLGMMIHGGLALSHLAHYSFKAYVQGEKSNEKWNTVDSYARACFTDFSCFAVAALSAFCLYHSFTSYKKLSLNLDELSYSQKENLVKSAYFLPIAGIGILAPSAFYPSYYLSSLIGNSDYRTGMYVSLEARNALGLVNENGNLLNFSPSDKLEYKTESSGRDISYQFQGKTLWAMRRLVRNAEFDLIDLVKDLNIWNQQNKHPLIPCSYPLKGSEIAKIMEIRLQEKQNSATMQLGSVDDQNVYSNKNVFKIIQQLKKLDYKITAFNNFIYDTKYLSINGSIQFQILESLNKDAPIISIIKPPSYVPENEYKKYFNDSIGSQRYRDEDPNEDPNAFTLYKFYDGLNLKPTSNRNKGNKEYEAFFECLVIAKQDAGKDILTSLPSLFDLKEGFSRTDYNKAWRKLPVAIHPDKNPDRKEEADVLFKAFVTIREQLEKDLEKREKPNS